MQSKTLIELIPYRRTVWMTGFLKTTISAIIIVTLIDKWKEQKKKEELEIIDKRAAEIAEEKILEAMKKLEN